jgi:Transposase DDE domain group 1
MGPPIGCSGLSRASCRSGRPGAWPNSWRVAQFDTLRNRLIKLVTEVTEMADRIQIALASVFPVEEILTVVSARLGRFVT